MATATGTTLISKETSHTSIATYYKATLASISKEGTTLSFSVQLSITLGSSTNLSSGSSRVRTAYVYNSSGTLLGSAQLKNSTTSWSKGNTYTGTVSCTATVSTGAGTLSGCYIRIQYSATSAYGSGTASCYWDGSASVSGGSVGNTFSIAYDASGTVYIKIDGSWTLGTPYRRESSWSAGEGYLRNDGAWKQGTA